MSIKEDQIVILTGNHICHNPRVFKEALTLAQAGYDVEVLGAVISHELARKDRLLCCEVPFRFTSVIDCSRSNLNRLTARMQRKIGNKFHALFRIGNRWQFAPVLAALRNVAINRRPALYIAHSESAMIVANDLLSSGRRVAVDMEDWFSEDLLPEARRNRPVNLFRNVESRLLQSASYATCPSKAMSKALGCEFNCPEPFVVYNSFPWADRAKLDGCYKDRCSGIKIPSIFWYSQSLGPGRGLEDLFEALPHLNYPFELHLRGNPVAGFYNWLHERLPAGLRSRLFTHQLVSNEDLLSRIAEHDIGFAGEMKFCRSRDLTITNKILHYLLGGLAVVASDTEGQKEVASQALNAVCLFPSGQPKVLARRINELLGSSSRLLSAKNEALLAAKATFCWEQTTPTLLSCVSRALKGAG
jgi:hypothetical protein